MIDVILQIVAPHHCYGCGQTGSVLCANCKYDIVDEPFEGCIVCAAPSVSGICHSCKTSYEMAWCVGERTDTLERLINGLKFDRVKAAAVTLADLMGNRLPTLPVETVIVPVPTIAPHVRQRGYDQTLLIARRFAKQRNLRLSPVLRRSGKQMQRGQSKSIRLKQAQTAFECTEVLDPSTPYLVIDDVVTTNATVRYAAQALKDAGAQAVWVAVGARQPLDKSGTS